MPFFILISHVNTTSVFSKRTETTKILYEVHNHYELTIHFKFRRRRGGGATPLLPIIIFLVSFHSLFLYSLAHLLSLPLMDQSQICIEHLNVLPEIVVSGDRSNALRRKITSTCRATGMQTVLSCRQQAMIQEY